MFKCLKSMIKIYTRERVIVAISKVQGRALILFLGMLALVVAFILTSTILTPKRSIISMAHASSSDPVSGCASCHTKPIAVDCTQCHPTPPTTIDDDISFPHHDPSPGGPPDNCQAGNCHDGTSNDTRFIKSVEASMEYCGKCHHYEHSSK